MNPLQHRRTGRGRPAIALVLAAMGGLVFAVEGPSQVAARSSQAIGQASAQHPVRLALRFVEAGTGGSRTVPNEAYLHLPGDGKPTYIATRPYKGASLCSGVAGSPATPEEIFRRQPDAIHLWVAEARLVSSDFDRIVVDLAWKHYVTAPGGAREEVAGARGTITLKEGQPYVLDFVRANDVDRDVCRVANVTIDLVANLKYESAVADEVLAYEAWLVHDDGRGKRHSERAQASGLQGESTHVAFTPMRWPIDRTGCSLYTQVVGTVSADIRGALRPDGRIDLQVRPSRGITQILGERPSNAGTGMTMITASLGEAVTFVLPDVTGNNGFGFPCKPASPPQPPLPNGVRFNPAPPHLKTTDALLFVDYGQFLAGQKTSLVITARKQAVEE